MARFTIIHCRKLTADISEFDVRLLSDEVREGDTFSFKSIYDLKAFRVLSIRPAPTHTTLVCAGALDYDDEITRITLDTVPPYGTQPILRPLLPDMVERIRLAFPDTAEVITQRLSYFRHEGTLFMGDRIIRGLIFCAWRFPQLSLEQWIELAQQDWRDLIVAAEYDRVDRMKQIRNFNLPFCDEDFFSG